MPVEAICTVPSDAGRLTEGRNPQGEVSRIIKHRRVNSRRSFSTIGEDVEREQMRNTSRGKSLLKRYL